MPRRKDSAPLRPESLDLGYLALFVGMRVNEVVLEEVHAAGFADLRHSHGYVFQHLLGGPRSIGELAALLEVTQQAASKSVAELVSLGYVEQAPSEDARVRRVGLSAHGLAAIEKTRAVRASLEERFKRRQGRPAVDEARRVLAEVLEGLGGTEAVRTRRVRAPR